MDQQKKEVQKQEVQKQEVQKEQVYTIKFYSSQNTEELVKVNKKILEKLDPINFSYNPIDQIQDYAQDNDPLIISNMITKYDPNVYKHLNNYIEAHMNDDENQNNTNQQKKQPYSCNRLKDLISEKDYNVVKQMKRSELYQLANLADYLHYDELVQLMFSIIQNQMAGKSPEEITKWLDSDK